MIIDLLHFTGQDFTAAPRERAQEDFKVLFNVAPYLQATMCDFVYYINIVEKEEKANLIHVSKRESVAIHSWRNRASDIQQLIRYLKHT